MRLQAVLLFLVTTEGKKKQKENDDEVASNIDVFPAPFPHPVPFGHIFNDGIGDILPGRKQPIDPLELRLHTPLTNEEREMYLKAVPKTNILTKPDPKKNVDTHEEFKRLGIPIEDYVEEDHEKEGNKTRKPDARPGWFRFEDILDHNVRARPPTPIIRKKVNNASTTEKSPTDEDKTKYFSANDFRLNNDPQNKIIFANWPGCDKFEKKTQILLLKDIVNIDWVPFYVWTTRHYVASLVHRFSFPTKKAVIEYKKTYGPYLNLTVDWESPKLMLHDGEMEMLLIAADRNGLFHGIPKIKLPYGIRHIKNPVLPVTILRLRIEDPYLAMMYCDEYYATIMAAPGAEPTTDEEKTEEASVLKIKFQGFPITRDLEMEERAKKAEIDRQIELEETKFIKAIDTEIDIGPE